MCIFHSMNTSENHLKGFCDRCYSGNKDNSRTCSILDKNTYKQAEFTSAFRWCSSKTVSENGCNFRPSWLIPFSQQCTQNNGSASKNTELLPSRDSHTPLLFFFHKYTRYYLLPSTPDQVSELATFHSQECPAQVQPIDRLSEISRFSLNAGERQNENTFSWAATKSRKLPVWKKVINIFSFLTFSTDKV